MFECYRGKRVLVTGHTGFKGSWLCEWLLALGAEVYGFSNGIPTKPSLFQQLRLAKRIKQDIRGDIRDRAAVRKAVLKIKPDFVFHLAAQPLVRLSYEQPVETFDTNVMGTIHVLDALRMLSLEAKARGEGEGEAKARGEGEGEAKARGEGEGEQRRVKNSTVRLGLQPSPYYCSAVLITTDKCYENRETIRPYRETDPMGGYDPYSCSKGCDELVISSYRRSFFNSPDSPVWIASARAGNVIGGGDWARDRIVPDAMRAWLGEEAKAKGEGEGEGEAKGEGEGEGEAKGEGEGEGEAKVRGEGEGEAKARGEGEGEGEAKEKGEGEQRMDKNSTVRLGLSPSPLIVRNSKSTRPWQHVLEPLSGYLTLGAALDARKDFGAVASGFNFGPNPNANRTVKDVVEELLKHTKGKWIDKSDPKAVHEAGLLNLNIAKAKRVLGWKPTWNFEETIAKVAEWYVGVEKGEKPLELTQRQIAAFRGEG